MNKLFKLKSKTNEIKELKTQVAYWKKEAIKWAGQLGEEKIKNVSETQKEIRKLKIQIKFNKTIIKRKDKQIKDLKERLDFYESTGYTVEFLQFMKKTNSAIEEVLLNGTSNNTRTPKGIMMGQVHTCFECKKSSYCNLAQGPGSESCLEFERDHKIKS